MLTQQSVNIWLDARHWNVLRQAPGVNTYLQFLHFSPNNIPFPHTMHVWDIQYLVENLQAKHERLG